MNRIWYTYGWALTKNICELYRTDDRPANTYTYTPYGAVTPACPDLQPRLWSSEYHDAELGLVYYNCRHYNPAMGRWMGRDRETDNLPINLYLYCSSSPIMKSDRLGLYYQEADPNMNIPEIERDRSHQRPNDVAHASVNFQESNPEVVKEKKNSYRIRVDNEIFSPYIIYYKNSPYNQPGLHPLDNRNQHGITTREHELIHVRTSIKIWNDFVKEVSIYDISYCSRECAEKAVSIVKIQKEIYSNINSIQQKDIDIADYRLNSIDRGIISQLIQERENCALRLVSNYQQLNNELKKLTLAFNKATNKSGV